MKRIVAVVATVLLTACTSQPPLYDFTLSWGGDHIHADLIYNTSQDTVTLFYGDVGYGGQRDIFGCVKNLKSDNFSLFPDSAALKTVAIRNDNGPLKIGYDIACTLPDEGLNCPKEMFRPNITKDFIYINGINLFMRDSDDNYGGKADLRWNTIPDFPVFCTYDPTGNLSPLHSDIRSLISAVIVADRELNIDTVEVCGTKNFVVTAPRSNREYNRNSIKEYFSSFYTGICKFWEEDSLPTYSLVIYPFEKIPFETSGIGLNHAFCSRYNRRSDTILNGARIDLFSHEIGHNWISADWGNQWFGEGFNEYQTMYMVAATGIKPYKSYVDYINNSLSRLHHSAIRNMPNDSIAVHFWKLGDYSWIPYWRGNVYAFRLMGQIEEATGTIHPFKELMMSLKGETSGMTRERFINSAKEFLDSTLLEEEFERYIIQAQTMELDHCPLLSGLKLIHLDDGTPQIQISDTAKFQAHFCL